jgi:hypothetical protein
MSDSFLLRAYAKTIQAMADKVERPAAQAAVERALAAIAKTTDPDRLQAYGAAIQALADKAERPAAQAIIVPAGGFSPKPAPAEAGGPTLDCLPTRLLPVRPGALTPLPPSVPGKADRHLPCRALAVLC